MVTRVVARTGRGRDKRGGEDDEAAVSPGRGLQPAAAGQTPHRGAAAGGGQRGQAAGQHPPLLPVPDRHPRPPPRLPADLHLGEVRRRRHLSLFTPSHGGPQVQPPVPVLHAAGGGAAHPLARSPLLGRDRQDRGDLRVRGRQEGGSIWSVSVSAHDCLPRSG